MRLNPMKDVTDPKGWPPTILQPEKFCNKIVLPIIRWLGTLRKPAVVHNNSFHYLPFHCLFSFITLIPFQLSVMVKCYVESIALYSKDFRYRCRFCIFSQTSQWFISLFSFNQSIYYDFPSLVDTPTHFNFVCHFHRNSWYEIYYWIDWYW